MSNRLKEVFSAHEVNIEGKINFNDAESSAKFADAYNFVYENGTAVEINGVLNMCINIKNDELNIPLTIENIKKTIIEPSIDKIPLVVMTKLGKREIDFMSLQTKSEIILETKDDEIVFLKLLYNKETHHQSFTWRLQFDRAKNIQEISDSLCTTLAVIKKLFESKDKGLLFIHDNSSITLDEMKSSLRLNKDFFDKLVCLEKELNIKFLPSEINSINEYVRDVEELFLLLVKKKIIRLNAKLTATESTGITLGTNGVAPNIGEDIALTFKQERIYTIFDHEITIYTANYLSNAIITKIINNDKNIKILYGDVDSKPMYISFSGFKTEAEAMYAMENIMQKRKEYENALTVDTHYKIAIDDLTNVDDESDFACEC